MKTTCHAGSTHAQTHSHDYRIRVNRERLQEMAFVHLCSYEASEVTEDTRRGGIAITRMGTTEWQTSVDGIAVSMAWDWMQMCDGAMRLLRHVAPRSNLQIVDGLGYDMAIPEALAHIWERIDHIEWHAHAALCLQPR